jgi:polyribonucleotide nucleotidyltransferase
MGRKVKQEILINNNESLSGLMQETYNDACLQITEAQKTINELSSSASPEGVDDLTKIAKEKGGLLKIKDSGIRIKLELAKLQSDIIKNGGNVTKAITERSNGKVSVDDFDSVREMLKQNKKEADIASEFE